MTVIKRVRLSQEDIDNLLVIYEKEAQNITRSVMYPNPHIATRVAEEIYVRGKVIYFFNPTN